MSHSGTYLRMTNKAASPCSISPLPEIKFSDAKHAPLAIETKVPNARGMHPGPVVRPRILQPGQSLRAALRWVSSPVYGADGGVCVTPATVEVKLEQDSVSTRLAGTICGPRTDQITVTRTRFEEPAQAP